MGLSMTPVPTQTFPDRHEGPAVICTGEVTHWEPFREGAPGPMPWLPLMSLPVAITDIHNSAWTRSNLKPRVESILSDHQILPISVELRERPPHPDAEYKHPPRMNHTTVFIIAHRQNDNGWFKAISEIRKLLCNTGLKHVSVEIVDPRAFVEKAVAPVPRNDPLAEIWETGMLRQRVHEIIRSTGWRTLDLVRKGDASQPRSTYKTTIVISLPLDDFRTVIEEQKEIEALLHENGLHDVEVDFRRCLFWGGLA